MGYTINNSKRAGVVKVKSRCLARNITEVLNSDSWAGKRCFVLCGGPSLEGFDFNRIRSECTIGINKSFTQFDTTICYAMDQRFYDMLTYPNRSDQKNMALHNAWVSFSGLKVFPRVDEKVKFDPSIYYVRTIKKRLVSLDLSQGIHAGGNSGFGGMMLAIALGSRQIYLLGADLKVDEKRKKTHFHDGYENQRIENVIKVLRSFKIEFEYFAESIRDAGVEVINLNLDSALECFTKKDLREIV